MLVLVLAISTILFLVVVVIVGGTNAVIDGIVGVAFALLAVVVVLLIRAPQNKLEIIC